MNKACPACQKIYKIAATLIGKRILCTKCKTVLIVTDQGLGIPEPQLPPPASPPAQAPASPVPPKPAVHWQQGLVPPPQAPSTAVPPQPVVYWQQGLVPPPQPAPAPPRSAVFDLDDDGDDDSWEPRRSPRWLLGFGSGCGLVKWGMWVNFAGFAYLILLLEFSLLGAASKSKELVLVDKLGLYIPLYLFELAGTGMMLAGWWRMTAAPANSGAVGLMTGASILAGLRALTLFVGTVYLIMAVSAKGLDGIRYLFNSTSALTIAEICLLVATFSAIPGMAVIGGEIPSRRLRQQAGWVTLIHQILAIVLLTLVAVGMYLIWMGDFLGGADLGRIGDVPADARPDTPRRTGAARAENAGPSDPIPIMMFLLLAILAIQGAYTYLHYSLYAVGQHAAARGGDDR